MLHFTSKYSNALNLLFIVFLVSCNSSETQIPQQTKVEKEVVLIDSSSVLKNDSNSIMESFKVLILPCANGYDYAAHNYDFNPVIEKELNKFENIVVKPFPYKTLMGVAYLGVYDKKYCPPIIEKVNVDFLILTRFEKNYDISNHPERIWGYQIRIVNTETLEQTNSIRSSNLSDYSKIEEHIKDNVLKLKMDIEKLY